MGSPSPSFASAQRRVSPRRLSQTTLSNTMAIIRPSSKKKMKREQQEQTPPQAATPLRTSPRTPRRSPKHTIGTVPLERFLSMWKAVEEDEGQFVEDFEDSASFRKANSEVDASESSLQTKAQYGRLLFKATQILFEKVMKLKYYHQFLDIGHGVGNTVLQAAYCFGCESLGIELVSIRHERALVYQEKMAEVDKLINQGRDGMDYYVGNVRMRHGSLEDPVHREFLTKHVDVAYCNNFGEVLGERSRKSKALYTMDDYLAGNFCLQKPGSIMVTLYPLSLGYSRDEANAVRMNQGLVQSHEASFYVEDQFIMQGSGLLSWTNKPFTVYKYTRLPNNTFLCCNPDCPKAQSNTPIQSYKVVEGDKVVVNRCDCKIQRKTRSSNKRNYQVPTTVIHVD